MNLKDLIFVLDYIQKSILDKQLRETYQELTSLLTQAQSSPTPELSTQIDEKRAQIRELQENLEPDTWDYFKQRLFRDFGADKVLGKIASQDLEGIFIRNQTNPNGAITELNEFVNKLNELLQRVQAVRSGISSLENVPNDVVLAEDEEVVELVFDHEVAVETLERLEDVAGDWNIILKSFAEVSGEPPSSAKIYSVSKNSPLGIILIAKKIVADVILETVSKILDNIEKILKLKKSLAEIEALELQNDSLKVKIDAEKAMADLQVDLAKFLVKKYKKEVKDGKNNPEMEMRVQNSISMLHNFIQGGGRVDVSSDGSVEKSLTSMQLAKQYTEIEAISDSMEKRKLLKPAEEVVEEEPESDHASEDPDLPSE
jgi:hypothetical protein